MKPGFQERNLSQTNRRLTWLILYTALLEVISISYLYTLLSKVMGFMYRKKLDVRSIQYDILIIEKKTDRENCNPLEI